MKKLYNSPEMEIEKFTVDSSAITTSDPEDRKSVV